MSKYKTPTQIRQEMRIARRQRRRRMILDAFTRLQHYLDATGLIPAVKALTGEQLRNTNDQGSKKRNK